LAVKFPEGKTGQKATRQLKKLASGGHNPLNGPITIVSGGCDASVELQMQGYRQVIIEGFQDFHGTVISGGTTAGVSGLIGEVGSKYPDAVKTVGYIPHRLPAGVRQDNRYGEVRYTDGDDFSPLESVQYWIDIITSGIPFSQVKVLGINGGAISAAEYRIALALGVQVAVLENSGREADKLIVDGDWANSKTLICLPKDSMTIGAFIGGAGTQLEPEIREIVARAIHEN
jgi:hypothetical protein